MKYVSKDIPETLSTKFAASFSQYASRNDYFVIMRPVESELLSIAISACSGRPFDNSDCRDLIQTAARGFAKQTVSSAIRDIMNGVVAISESPIEIALSLSLGMIARARHFALLYDFGAGRCIGDVDGEVSLKIQPQVPIEDYRIDCLLTMQVIEQFDDDLRIFSKQVVVECDGHEFHERTKEQVAKDKQRDRFLQTRSLTVFHFTGSEIWTDVFKCAEEVVEYLWSDMRRQREIADLPRKRPQTFRSLSANSSEVSR